MARSGARAAATPENAAASPGALRRLMHAAAALFAARAEFASVELALARAQLVRWLLLALLALLLGLLGLMSATALLTLLLWPALGWVALLLPALAYLAAAAWVVRRLTHEVQSAPPLLHETLHELQNDRDALLRAMSGAAASDQRKAESGERDRPAVASTSRGAYDTPRWKPQNDARGAVDED